jgi:hypothetical protein
MGISGFTPIKDPPYSLDVTLCDFSCFRQDQREPKDTVLRDEEEPCIAIRGLVIAIPGDLLLNVLSE